MKYLQKSFLKLKKSPYIYSQIIQIPYVMMRKSIFFIAVTLLYNAVSGQNNEVKPIDVEVYQLDNGLTVILNEDHNLPQVFGSIAVRAGGKDDPAGATGMAHYQEHMLFKGTETLGTTSWEAEKPHIDSIFRLYDELAKTSEPDARSIIQEKINQESLKANEYAIPNELSNLIKSIGGTRLNAGTGPDQTVYYNAFPPSQIEKWLDLYSHRFEKPVFRSFQAELEVVYEEKNMYSDQFVFPLIENFNRNFFKNHPYGQQTLIGTVEDLKNPSLSKMYDFFKTWYVPNNMALILVGDFDKQLVKPLIAEKFGKWERKELPVRKTWEEQPFNGREFVEMKLSPVKLAILGFRTVPAGDPDEIPLKICNAILSNQSETGLFDKLVLENKLMAAQILEMPYNDHGVSLVLMVPKILGQKLSNAEELIMNELARLKKGEFDSVMVENIKLELYRDYQLQMEQNEQKSQMFAAAYGRNQTITDLLLYPEQLLGVTKADVIEIAKKYYGDNYLAFYSNMGFPKKQKIEKPGYKPLSANKTAESEYARKFRSIPVTNEKPKFFNLDKDISHITVSDQMNIYCAKNPLNNIFTLKLKFKIGNENLPDLKYATEMMGYASPEGMKLDDFKTSMASYGCTYSISGDESYTTIEITGLEKSFSEALNLISRLIEKPVLDQSKVNILYEGEKANRKIERSEPDNVAEALYAYIRFDNKSEFLDRMSLAGIKKLQATVLTDAFKSVAKYGVEIHYAGNAEPNVVADLCKSAIKITGSDKVDTPVVPDLKQYSENTVFFVNKKKATQSKVYFLVNGFPYSPELQADINAFNMYFGGDFSGLVLQEIREYRSLAYTAGARFVPPVLKGKETCFSGYVGTQADKTLEAMVVFDTLMHHMPIKSERTKMIREYLMQSSVSDRPGFRNLSEHMIRWQNLGFTMDPAKYLRDAYENLEFEKINEFYQKHLESKPVVICIVGDKRRIDMEQLGRFGKVVFVKESSLFSK